MKYQRDPETLELTGELSQLDSEFVNMLLDAKKMVFLMEFIFIVVLLQKNKLELKLLSLLNLLNSIRFNHLGQFILMLSL